MKKSIIAAGAASIALAALPMAGVFAAAEAVTDNLTATVNSTCSLTRTGAGATTGDNKGAWTSGSETYTISLDAGSTGNMGTSTFTIVCNDQENGHYLTVATTGLSAGNDQSEAAQGAAINYSNKAVSNTASSWNISVEAVSGTGTAQMPTFNSGAVDGGILQMTSGSVDLYGSAASKNTTMLNGAKFTATYNIGVKTEQPSGTYKGTAVYTLTHGA